VFNLAINSTITLSDQIQITDDLNINQPGLTGLTISGNGLKGVLRLNAGNLSIYDTTITGGGIQTTAGKGGGIFAGTGTSLTLNDSTVSGNTVNTAGAGIYGFEANITLNNSTVSQNEPGAGLGVNLHGGGIAAIESSLTLNNSTVSGNSSGFGGGIYLDQSDLNMNGSQITNNRAFSGGGLFSGLSSGTSGIIIISDSEMSFNYAGNSGGGMTISGATSLSISNSTISSNTAGGHGGGILVGGTSTNIESTTVSANRAQNGAGVYVASPSVVRINNSTISGNAADDLSSFSTSSGGGILVTSGATATITNSTISGNTSTRWGGGAMVSMRFFPDPQPDPSKLEIINSTLSNNQATNSAPSPASANGGGLAASGLGKLVLLNSTVSGNTADVYGGGIYRKGADTVSLKNSIIAGNTAPNGAEIKGNSGAGMTSINNLLGHSGLDNASAFFNFTPDASDIVATSDGTLASTLGAILKPLANNGGPTQTHALPAGSPAIDSGDQPLCLSEAILLDEQGTSRDEHCDIGAYEYQESSSCFVIRAQSSKTVVFCL